MSDFRKESNVPAANIPVLKFKKTNKACLPCRNFKVGCDTKRPCERCTKQGMTLACVDVPTKTAQRGVKNTFKEGNAYQTRMAHAHHPQNHVFPLLSRSLSPPKPYTPLHPSSSPPVPQAPYRSQNLSLSFTHPSQPKTHPTQHPFPSPPVPQAPYRSQNLSLPFTTQHSSSSPPLIYHFHNPSLTQHSSSQPQSRTMSPPKPSTQHPHNPSLTFTTQHTSPQPISHTSSPPKPSTQHSSSPPLIFHSLTFTGRHSSSQPMPRTMKPYPTQHPSTSPPLPPFHSHNPSHQVSPHKPYPTINSTSPPLEPQILSHSALPFTNQHPSSSPSFTTQHPSSSPPLPQALHNPSLSPQYPSTSPPLSLSFSSPIPFSAIPTQNSPLIYPLINPTSLSQPFPDAPPINPSTSHPQKFPQNSPPLHHPIPLYPTKPSIPTQPSPHATQPPPPFTQPSPCSTQPPPHTTQPSQHSTESSPRLIHSPAYTTQPPPHPSLPPVQVLQQTQPSNENPPNRELASANEKIEALAEKVTQMNIDLQNMKNPVANLPPLEDSAYTDYPLPSYLDPNHPLNKDTMPKAVWQRSDKQFLDCNEPFAKLLGYNSVEDLLSCFGILNFFDILSPLIRERVKQLSAHAISKNIRYLERPGLFLCKNGSEISVYVKITYYTNQLVTSISVPDALNYAEKNYFC